MIYLGKKKKLRELKKYKKELQLEYNSYNNTLSFLNSEISRVNKLESIGKEDIKYEIDIIKTKIRKVTKKMEKAKEELDGLEI